MSRRIKPLLAQQTIFCLTKLDQEFLIGILQCLFEMSEIFSDVLVESLHLTAQVEIGILE